MAPILFRSRIGRILLTSYIPALFPGRLCIILSPLTIKSFTLCVTLRDTLCLSVAFTHTTSIDSTALIVIDPSHPVLQYALCRAVGTLQPYLLCQRVILCQGGLQRLKGPPTLHRTI